MTLLLDTGPFAFLLTGSLRLPDSVRAKIAAADTVLVPAIVFYEIGQKVRIGKWPQMAPFAQDLDRIAVEDGFEIVPLTSQLATRAALLDWDHRDPFDRMIAATALQEKVPLVSSDAAFDALGIERI